MLNNSLTEMSPIWHYLTEIEIKERKIEYFYTPNKKAPFAVWLRSLKDHLSSQVEDINKAKNYWLIWKEFNNG